jgi:diguanylate cyclase (GGDEF)-like protein/PAS domain S-box-containing protein
MALQQPKKGHAARSSEKAVLGGQSEADLLRDLLGLVPDYLFIKDTQSRFVIANPPVADDLGLKVQDLIGKSDFDLHPRERAEKFYADEQNVMRSGQAEIDIEEFVLTAAGRKKWLSTSKLALRGSGGEVIGLVGVCRDITDRKQVEAALIESESRWSFALESAGQGVWDHNLRDRTAYFSPVWRRMRGIGLDETVDPSREAWLARVHPDDRDRLIRQTEEQNRGKRAQNSFEYREKHRDGHYIWILSRGKPVEWLPDGSVARIIGTDTDITSLKQAEVEAAAEKESTYRRHLAALEKAHEATEAAHQLAQSLARHDPLTGLPNRRVFSESLQTAVERALSNDGVNSVILIIDLDRFKPVNDVHGHAAGDEVLREVASRLGSISRGRDMVARLGGDEFGIILDCVAPEEPFTAAATLAQRIIASVAAPIEAGGQRFEVGASIGIAICPLDGADSETLLRAADMAMYRSKEDGRGAYRFFKHSMEKALRQRVALEDDVRKAVSTHDIRPYYQPLMRLAENRLVGFEVLARWHHPGRGEVEPEVFIPIVEKLGLIGELTYDLLRRACLDARDWPSEVTISLNVSPLHFGDPLLPVKVLAILSETRFPPRRLEIEVTESALTADIVSARTALVALQDLGIKISLDDFGTGYSSLYNLRELRFDKIKIDRSFVLSMDSNDGSAKIVRSVIDLAKSLGLPVIAEGIEHREAMEEIIKRGGEFGQGFYFGRAMPADSAAIFAGAGGELRRA